MGNTQKTNTRSTKTTRPKYNRQQTNVDFWLEYLQTPIDNDNLLAMPRRHGTKTKR